MSLKVIKAGLNAMFSLDPSDSSKRLISFFPTIKLPCFLTIMQNDTS